VAAQLFVRVALKAVLACLRKFAKADDVSYRYHKRQRLTKADEFSSVFSLRRTIHSSYFQVFIRPNGLHQARLGLVVGKSVARHAVRRNYMKRVIREYFRLHAKEVDGFDIVVRVKQLFDRSNGTLVQQALQDVWRKINKCRV
jgi:ribonuclease P protein component